MCAFLGASVSRKWRTSAITELIPPVSTSGPRCQVDALPPRRSARQFARFGSRSQEIAGISSTERKDRRAEQSTRRERITFPEELDKIAAEFPRPAPSEAGAKHMLVRLRKTSFWQASFDGLDSERHQEGLEDVPHFLAEIRLSHSFANAVHRLQDTMNCCNPSYENPTSALSTETRMAHTCLL